MKYFCNEINIVNIINQNELKKYSGSFCYVFGFGGREGCGFLVVSPVSTNLETGLWVSYPKRHQTSPVNITWLQMNWSLDIGKRKEQPFPGLCFRWCFWPVWRYPIQAFSVVTKNHDRAGCGTWMDPPLFCCWLGFVTYLGGRSEPNDGRAWKLACVRGLNSLESAHLLCRAHTETSGNKLET